MNMGRGDRATGKRKLNLGCGLGAPILEEWINLDGPWNARLARHPVVRKFFRAFHLLPQSLLDLPWSADVIVHDVSRPLPFHDNSLDAQAISILASVLRPSDNGLEYGSGRSTVWFARRTTSLISVETSRLWFDG